MQKENPLPEDLSLNSENNGIRSSVVYLHLLWRDAMKNTGLAEVVD